MKSKLIFVIMKWLDCGVMVFIGKDKVELFCKFFVLVFICFDLVIDVDEDVYLYGLGFDILDFMCFSVNVGEFLFIFDVNKVIGLDGLFVCLFWEVVFVIFDLFLKLFNMFLNRGKLFCDWKCVNIILVYKNGGKEYVFNYCLIFLILFVVKILEKLVIRYIMVYLEDYDLLSFY